MKGGRESDSESASESERPENLTFFLSLSVIISQTIARALAAAYQGKVGSVGQRRSVGKGAAAAGLILLLLVVAIVRRVGV